MTGINVYKCHKLNDVIVKATSTPHRLVSASHDQTLLLFPAHARSIHGKEHHESERDHGGDHPMAGRQRDQFAKRRGIKGIRLTCHGETEPPNSIGQRKGGEEHGDFEAPIIYKILCTNKIRTEKSREKQGRDSGDVHPHLATCFFVLQASRTWANEPCSTEMGNFLRQCSTLHIGYHRN